MAKLHKNHQARSPYEPTEQSDGSQRNSRAGEKKTEAKAAPKKKAAKKKSA